MNKLKEVQNLLKAEMIMEARALIQAAGSEQFSDALIAFDRLCEKVSAYRYLTTTGDFDFMVQLMKKNDKEQKLKEAETEINAEANHEPVRDKIPEKPVEPKKKDDREIFRRASETVFRPKRQKEFAGSTGLPPVQLGLADKIALLKNLFEGDEGAFDIFIRQVNEAQSYDQALMVVHAVKNRFDWTGKDEYEFRLLQLIQARFA